MGAIAYRKNCKVCNMIKADQRLKERIYSTTYYRPNGYETLADVSRDLIGIVSDKALYNHCKKHQTLTPLQARKISEAIIQKESRLPTQIRAMSQEQAAAIIAKEGDIIDGAFTTDPSGNLDYVSLWDAFIALGKEKLKNGNMTITATHILKAADSKANYDDKKKDRQVELIKSIAAFAAPVDTSHKEADDSEPGEQ